MRVSSRALAATGVAAVCAAVLMSNTAAPAQTAPGNIYELVDAPGMDLVQQECTTCHGITNITQSGGYPRHEWERLMRTMVVLDDATFTTILDYLSTNYGDPNAGPAAPEPVNVSFRELAGADGVRMSAPTPAPGGGAIWYLNARGNAIGRLDMATRQTQEWPLPARTRPSSIVFDAQGGLWFIGAESIGKFDPATGQSEVHALSDRNARNPSAAVFDTGGNLWFTVEDANTIGRFDPRTNEVRLAQVATARARPHGLSVGANGALWVGCAASNCLIRVNTETLELTEVRLPDARANAARVGVDRDGAVWYTNAAGGAIGRYDPNTSAFKEWASPGGANAEPSGLVVIDRNIWFNEAGGRAGVLARFDSRSEQFQTWPLPAAAGAVHDLGATAAGNVLVHSDGGAERTVLAEPTRAQ